MDKKIELINNYMTQEYGRMLREGEGFLQYKNIVPGSKAYETSLWDWDSLFTDVALRQLFVYNNMDVDISEYEKGCVLNFLVNGKEDGSLPIFITPTKIHPSPQRQYTNIHKPVLAQHIVFISENTNGGYSWIEPHFEKVERFMSY